MKKPVGRKEDIIVQELDGEVLIYDLRKNKAYCLNETSSLIWKACDGDKTVSEIGNYVNRKLDSKANEDLIWLALDQLKKANLIVNAEDVPASYEGMTRREVIKKVGLGSMIALPIVASLTAPLAVHAGTCVAEGENVMVAMGSAQTFSQCQSQLEAQCCAMNGLMSVEFDSNGGGTMTICMGVC